MARNFKRGKKMKTILFLILFSIVNMYLIFAIGAVNINIFEWNELLRIVYCLILTLGLIVGLIYYCKNHQKIK